MAANIPAHVAVAQQANRRRPSLSKISTVTSQPHEWRRAGADRAYCDWYIITLTGPKLWHDHSASTLVNAAAGAAGSQTAVGEDIMCKLCGKPQAHVTSRRNFLKGTAATGLAAGAMGLLGSGAEAQGFSVTPPPHTGAPGRRYVIRNGYVM